MPVQHRDPQVVSMKVIRNCGMFSSTWNLPNPPNPQGLKIIVGDGEERW